MGFLDSLRKKPPRSRLEEYQSRQRVAKGGLELRPLSTPPLQSVSVGVADGSVTTAKLADDAVTTAKIDDAAVTPAKLSAPGLPFLVVLNGAAGEITSLAQGGATVFQKVMGDCDQDATEVNVEFTLPYAMTFTGMAFKTGGTNNVTIAGQGANVTLRKNAAATTLTIAIGTTAVNTILAVTQTVTYAAGDTICLQLVPPTEAGKTTNLRAIMLKGYFT